MYTCTCTTLRSCICTASIADTDRATLRSSNLSLGCTLHSLYVVTQRSGADSQHGGTLPASISLVELECIPGFSYSKNSTNIRGVPGGESPTGGRFSLLIHHLVPILHGLSMWAWPILYALHQVVRRSDLIDVPHRDGLHA